MIKNVILCTAPSSGGKTTYLEAFASIAGLPYQAVISDTDFIATSVQDDHFMNHGNNHTHPVENAARLGFIGNEYGGHDHAVSAANSVWPFMATSNWITDRTLHLFWTSILEQRDDRLILAELACGANGNKLGSPFAGVDISYNHLFNQFIQGALPPKVLDRILFCLHPETTMETRLRRSKLRPDRPTAVTLIFAHDDFNSNFRLLLDQKGIPVLSIDNNLNLGTRDGEHIRYLEEQLRPHGYLEQLNCSGGEGRGSLWLK